MGNINNKPYLMPWDAVVKHGLSSNGQGLFKGGEAQYVQWRVDLDVWKTLQKDYGQLPDFMYTEDKWLDKCMPKKPSKMNHIDDWASNNLAMIMPLRVVTVGNKGSGMFNHNDAFSTGVGHFQVVGRKKWHICSPNSSHLLY